MMNKWIQMIRSSPLAREDTLLGVCQAVGEEFGFNPLWLRIAFGVALLLSPAVVVAAYLVLGLATVIARLAFPSPAAREADEPRHESGAKAEAADGRSEPLDIAA